MNNDNKIVICENTRKIDMLKDIFVILQECRESYYCLDSLMEIFKGRFFVGIIAKEDEEKEKKINETYEKIKKEVIKIEETASLKEPIEDEPVTFNSNHIEYKYSDEILKLIKANLKLKAQIDRLQTDILVYLENLYSNNLEIIIEKEKIEKSDSLLFLKYKSIVLIETAFTRSVEEDKVVTYIIDCDNETIKKEQQLPETLRLRDYSFMCDKRRKIFTDAYKAFVEIVCMDLPRLRNENIQKSFSKQVTMLTWIIAAFTLIVTIVTILTYF